MKWTIAGSANATVTQRGTGVTQAAGISALASTVDPGAPASVSRISTVTGSTSEDPLLPRNSSTAVNAPDSPAVKV